MIYLTAALAVLYPLAVAVAVLALLRYLRERDQSERLERAGVLDRIAAMQAEHRKEVALLCQRIQAPEHAVVEHAQQAAGPPQVVYPRVDEEYEGERAAAIARIEQLEREGLPIPEVIRG